MVGGWGLSLFWRRVMEAVGIGGGVEAFREDRDEGL